MPNPDDLTMTSSKFDGASRVVVRMPSSEPNKVFSEGWDLGSVSGDCSIGVIGDRSRGVAEGE